MNRQQSASFVGWIVGALLGFFLGIAFDNDLVLILLVMFIGAVLGGFVGAAGSMVVRR